MGRSQSTPGLVESRGRVPLEEMWVSPIPPPSYYFNQHEKYPLFSPAESPKRHYSVPIVTTQHEFISSTSATSNVAPGFGSIPFTCGTSSGYSTTQCASQMQTTLSSVIPKISRTAAESPISVTSSVLSSSHHLLVPPSHHQLHSPHHLHSPHQSLHSPHLLHTPHQQNGTMLHYDSLLGIPITTSTCTSELNVGFSLSGSGAGGATTPLLTSSSHEALESEVRRLRERLLTVEAENATLSLKLHNQQWELESRLAEIEMQICRGGSSLSEASGENGGEMNEEEIEDDTDDLDERNRESVI